MKQPISTDTKPATKPPTCGDCGSIITMEGSCHCEDDRHRDDYPVQTHGQLPKQKDWVKLGCSPSTTVEEHNA